LIVDLLNQTDRQEALMRAVKFFSRYPILPKYFIYPSIIEWIFDTALNEIRLLKKNSVKDLSLLKFSGRLIIGYEPVVGA
tara:strand:- start:497 stop:736 length:240 start_codon:yes stop_codon:yes gene_type:complete